VWSDSRPRRVYLKMDHRMNRCHLKGSLGDSLHAVLCAAGFNIRWLLRMIIKKGLGLFLRLLQAAGWTDFSDLQRKLRGIFTVKPINSASMNWVVG
jgi:IS5 family transposase